MGELRKLVLYVTIDQEKAIKALYRDKGWIFIVDISQDSARLKSETHTPKHETKNPQQNTHSPAETVCLSEAVKATCISDPKIDPQVKVECLSKQNTCPPVKVTCLSEQNTDPLIKVTRLSEPNKEPCVKVTRSQKKKTNPSRKKTKALQKFIHDSEKVIPVAGQELATDRRLLTVPAEETSTNECVDEDVNVSDIDYTGENTQVISPVSSVSKTSASSQSETNSNSEIPAQKKGNNDEIKKVYKCQKCSYSSNVKSNYKRHITEVHATVRLQCSKCPKSFKSKPLLKAHELHAHWRKIACDKCDKTFTTRGGYHNHNRQVHLKEPLYKCEICNSSFIYKAHFKGHMQSHTSTNPFSCKVCGKTFRYKSSLTVHEKSKCTGVKCEKPSINSVSKKNKRVLCDICGDELSNKYSLKIHTEFLHSDKPKAECSVCGKQFKGYYSLNRHIKNAHNTDEQTTYSCEICGKVFNQLTILKQHIKRHKKQYSVYCTICGKGFYSNFKLKEHDRIHTGEKPFACTVCNVFKCATKNSLVKHMKIHEEKRSCNNLDDIQTNGHMGENSEETAAVEEKSCLPLTSDNATVIVLENMPMDDDLYKNSYNENGFIKTDEVSNEIKADVNLTNLGPMTLTNEMITYNPEPFNLLHGQENEFDPNLNADSFYGSMNINTPTDQVNVSQGLNILTVAMKMVNPDSYQQI